MSRSRPLIFLSGMCLLPVLACATSGVGEKGDPSIRDPGLLAEAGNEPGPDEVRRTVVPVILPDERVACPFEAIGTVTIKGPFVLPATAAPSYSDLLTGIKVKLGREAASMGADAALVRRLLYDRRQSGSPAQGNVRAVDALLLRFIEPECGQASR